jgi:hypothetical protein
MARVTLAGRGVMAGDLMANWIPIAVAEPLVRTSSAAWESYVEEHYADDPAGPWSDWEPAGVADVQARCAQFRLLGAVYDVAVDLKFTRMEERLNLTAHEQQGSDITNASGVCSIALDPDYYQPPAVQPRITGAGVVNLIVSAVSGSAFTVNSYTAAGAVAPNIPFTWTALGYGRTP